MAEIRLDWKGGTLHCGDVDLGVRSETDACRKLLELGLAGERDMILTFRGDMPCFRCRVKWGAAHTTATTGTGSVTFVKYDGVRLARTGVGRGRGDGTKAARARQRAAKEHNYSSEPEYHRQFDD